MSVIVSEEYITNIVNNVASVCNLSEWQYALEDIGSVTKALQFFGVLIPLSLSGVNNGEQVNYALMLKVPPADKRYRISGAITIMFKREIFMYSVVLEKYVKLLQTLPQYPYKIPRCYYVCKDYGKEVIAMEDLRADGYRPFTDKKILDVDHIAMCLKSLGRFHALSFILKERDPILYEEIKQECVPLSETTNKRFMEILKDRLNKALDKFSKTKYVPLLEKLTLECVKYIQSAYDSVQATCICHGDLWKENIVFKYKDNLPVSACIIDYQTARVSTPAFDVLYLITSSTNTDLRKVHFQQLLYTYYQEFDQTIQGAGLNSQKLYSMQDLEDDLKVVGPACLIVVNTAMWLANGLQEEGHVRSKTVWSTEEEKTRAVDCYKKIIRDIIEDYIEYNYLNTCL